MENSRIGVGPLQTQQTLAVAKTFRLGQTVQLAVESQNPQGTVVRYGELRLQCHTSLPFTDGQTIVGEVIATAPTLTIKLATSQSTTGLLSNTINSLLPRQTSLPPLLANLASYIGTPIQGDDTLANAIAPLVNNLSNAQDIASSNALKTAITNSGIFLENHLLQGAVNAATVSGDFKANLMRLLAVLLKQQSETPQSISGLAPQAGANLKPETPERNRGRAITPPYRGMIPQAQSSEIATLVEMDLPSAIQQLTDQTQGSLARIELMQLANLANQHNETPPISLELPLRHQQRIDLVSLCLEQQSRTTQTEAPEKTWSVTVALALPTLGPLSARLSLQHNRLSAQIWVEQAASADKVIEHLALLREHLAEAGLQIDYLNCEAGTMPKTSSFNLDIPLIDTQA